MTIRARAVSEEEREALTRLVRSRKCGAGRVRRAQIVIHALEGLSAPEIAARMELCGATVRFWLKRFNERGLQGLEEDMRSGRPPTYSAEEKSTVIRTALTRPGDLDLPFACWTLDRLVASLSEQGIGMRRSVERQPRCPSATSKLAAAVVADRVIWVRSLRLCCR
jgi:transposase